MEKACCGGSGGSCGGSLSWVTKNTHLLLGGHGAGQQMWAIIFFGRLEIYRVKSYPIFPVRLTWTFYIAVTAYIYVPLFYRKKFVSRANSIQESVHMSRSALAFLAPITRALPSSATGRKTEEAKIEMRQQQLSVVQ